MLQHTLFLYIKKFKEEDICIILQKSGGGTPKFKGLTNSHATLSNFNESYNIEAGTLKAYLVVLLATTYNPPSVTVAGTALSSQKIVGYKSMAVSGVMSLRENVYELTLNGSSGTVTVTYSGGSQYAGGGSTLFTTD